VYTYIHTNNRQHRILRCESCIYFVHSMKTVGQMFVCVRAGNYFLNLDLRPKHFFRNASRMLFIL